MLSKVEVRCGSKFVHIPFAIPEVKSSLQEVIDAQVEYQSFTNYKGETIVQEAGKYFWNNPAETEFRFHHSFKDQILRNLLSTFPEDLVDIIDVPVVEGVDVDIGITPNFTYKSDDQERYVKFLATHDSVTRVLPAYTGSGKTVSSIVAAAMIGKRVVKFIKPRYKDTWFEDLKWLVPGGIESGDVEWISGAKDLVNLIKRGLNDEPIGSIVLISANTFQAYISSYAKPQLVKGPDGVPVSSGQLKVDTKYLGVNPERFFEVCGFGTKTVDEAHEELEYNCILDAHNPMSNNSYLTATLTKERGKAVEMESRLYPKADRCEVAPPDKHVTLVAVNYRLDFFGKPLRYKSPMGYSHVNFENSLSKQPKRRKLYFDMITRVIHTYAKEGLEDGYKILIWFATTAMIDHYVKYLRPIMSKYKVSKYVAGSAKEDLYESDVIVSTLKKTGTGVDIPNLLHIFNTVSVSSKSSNYQSHGRIRPLKGEEPPKPHHIYFWTPDIPKQAEYHRKKVIDHQDRIIGYHERTYPGRI